MCRRRTRCVGARYCGVWAHECLALAEGREDRSEVTERVGNAMSEGDCGAALFLSLGFVFLILSDESVEGTHIPEHILARVCALTLTETPKVSR